MLQCYSYCVTSYCVREVHVRVGHYLAKSLLSKGVDESLLSGSPPPLFPPCGVHVPADQLNFVGMNRSPLPLSAVGTPTLATLTTCDAFIYLVRHGETTGNRDKIRQGQGPDFPLTDKGVLGALVAGEALKDVPFDAVYSSDLGRAVRTCELIVSKSRHVSSSRISLNRSLREINFGIREGLHIDTTRDQAKAIIAESQGISPEEVDDHAETDEELFRRHLHVLETIRDSATRPQLRVLCVTHGGFIRSFIRHLLPGIADQKIENCSFTVVRVKWNKDERFLSLEPAYYNYIEHLLNPELHAFNEPVF